jgi:hypothetical protein
MANGAGKYDDLCTHVRATASALGAIVIVVDGNKGSGFSVQMHEDDLTRIPNILEMMARTIREDLAEKGIVS